MSKYFLILLFLLPLYSQIETQKWQAKEVDFNIEQLPEKEYNLVTSDISSLLISSAQIAYYKLFSEYDGDNCPFYPSCSAFFVESVRETNLITGSLMFADRFTRDLNLFKSYQSYPMHSMGKFYDPVYKYAFYSAKEIVELEQSSHE